MKSDFISDHHPKRVVRVASFRLRSEGFLEAPRQFVVSPAGRAGDSSWMHARSSATAFV